MASTPPSQANFQLIIDALADYANLTGINLSDNPFSDKVQVSSSPGYILELLEEREKAFKEYREGSRRLISCLSPVVRVVHAFSGILGEAVTLVSQSYSIAFLFDPNFDRLHSPRQKLSLLDSTFFSPYVV